MPKILTLVVPVYQNSSQIYDFVSEIINIKPQVEALGFVPEILFINDGSLDDSYEILSECYQKNPDLIKVISFCRNFGAVNAVQAGLAYAEGDAVCVISADLQDPPITLLKMIPKLSFDYPAVYAIRKNRVDPISTKLFASLFYKIVRNFISPTFPKNGFDFFLINKEIAKQLCMRMEKNTHLQLLLTWMGYKYQTVEYDRGSRKKSKSTWSFSKKIKYFIDSLMGFSYLPIRLVSFIGVLIAVIAILMAVYLIIYRLFFGTNVAGYTAIIVSVMFLSGLQIIILGVFGEYLWRILDQVRNRPNYIISKTLGIEKSRDDKQI